jgi:pimeloyl-ACP methyl ester carboxylesterase
LPYLPVNGSRFHYVVDDLTAPWKQDADTMYIQHGAGRTLNFWRHWIPLLASRFRIVRRDLRGHGLSDIPDLAHEFSLDELVDDTLAFLGELGSEPIHYVGESISGVTGILSAIRAPDLFRSVTVIGSAPVADGTARRALAGDSCADIAAALEQRGTAAWVRDVLIPAGIISGGATPRQREWVIAEYGKTPKHVLQGITGRLSSLNLIPVLGELTVPTLIITSAASPISPLSGQVAMREAIPHAQLSVIEAPSHEVYVDRPEECVTALLRFLDGSGTRSGASTRREGMAVP